MSKKFKKIFKTLSLTSTLMLPITVLSAETDQKSTPSNSGDNSSKQGAEKKEEPKKEPKNDPEFDSFKDKATNKTKEGIKKALERFEAFAKEEIAKTEKLEKDFKKRFSKTTYLKILASFVKNNKQKIIDNPNENGFALIFPYVIGTNRKINIQDIEYNNQKYTSVWTGLTDPTDYKKALDKDGKFKIIKENQINDFDKARFDNAIEQYQKALNEKIDGLIYNEKDVLEIEKDFNLDFESSNEKNGYTIKPPKNYKTWDEYIKAKIKPRVIDFDLNLNIKLTQEDKKEEKPQKNPEIPPSDKSPDLLDQKKDPAANPEVFQGIPALSPEVRYNLITKDNKEIMNLYNSNKTNILAGKEDPIFFFRNPINTRYAYTVIALTEEGSNLLATVELKDVINPNAKRSFLIKVEKSNDARVALLTEQLFKSIQEVFYELYKAVGLDEKLDYDKLLSGAVSNALFHIVDSGVKLINNEKINQEFNKAIEVYKTDLKISEDFSYSNNYINGFKNNIRELILTALKTSRINNLPFYYSLVQSFNNKKFGISKRIEGRIKPNANLTSNKPGESKYEKELIAKNIDLNELNTFYQNLETKIYKLRKTTDLLTFNVSNWYKGFISNLSVVSKELLLLQDVIGDRAVVQPPKQNAQNKNQQNTTEDTSTVNAKYKELVNINNEARKQNNLINRNIGIGLTTVGFLGSIVNAISLVRIISQRKPKQYKRLSILLLIAFDILLIIGLVLLILGMKGI